MEVTKDGFSAKNEKIEVTAKIEKHKTGINVRRDYLKNISDEPVTLNVVFAKFTLDGGEYEVYSQYNGWQSESKGVWQPLTTAISARSESVRYASGAAPFMALWSNQHNRGVAFHINAYSAWEMKFSKTYTGGQTSIVDIDMGILADGLNITVEPGEVFELPEIIYYDFFNRVDMDAWKLHLYLNERYPRKEMPVIYNTWMFKFDRFDCDDILRQLEKAKEIGVDYFVIDAGWFGNGSMWYGNRGDWEENLTFGFRGRMAEIAEIVKKSGLKFGFWLEPECASQKADIYNAHPEYFLDGPNSAFIDFANDEAKEFIFNKTCELIDRYGAEYIKFDFNADLKFDKYKSGYTKYEKGHEDYVRRLKAKYPSLYIESCASGGMRKAIRDGGIYDGFWPSDNHSPYFCLDEFKNTVLRMPPQWTIVWLSITTGEKISYEYDSGEKVDKIFASNDCKWDSIVSVGMDYTKGFLTGRQIGLSFDLEGLNDEHFNELKDFIAKYKKESEFWKNAACHIITDTETMLVMEYRNEDFSKVELLVFPKYALQNNVCVYPVLNKDLKYRIVNDDMETPEDIFENGIDVPVKANYSCKTITLIGE